MLDLAGKRVTVMGLGRFGGGIGVTRWLAGQGADMLVTDLAPANELTESVRAIDDLLRDGSVRLRLGGHNVSDFTTCDLVIANPAVPKPWENRFLRAAEAAGIPVTTEISLLVERLPARERTIGVTGSVGKSTTTAMIAHAMMAATGDAALGGNIGGSLLPRLGGSAPAITARTWVALELSSAMLYWIDRTVRWSPRIAVVTNIAENHIDWHDSFEHYRACKQHLLERQEAGDSAILGRSVADWSPLTRGRAAVIGPDAFTGELRIPGGHNRENAAMAIAACRAAEPAIDPTTFARALATFPGLPHRLELVAERDRMRFYNDSKSTTPDATLRAVEAISSMPGMSESKVHLIAGGYDKRIDLSPIAALAARLAGMYTVGTTGRGLAARAGRRADSPAAEFADTVEHAVERAMARMGPGEALLLSPGCASWDQFSNYEQRGETFARCCRQHADAPTGSRA